MAVDCPDKGTPVWFPPANGGVVDGANANFPSAVIVNAGELVNNVAPMVEPTDNVSIVDPAWLGVVEPAMFPGVLSVTVGKPPATVL